MHMTSRNICTLYDSQPQVKDRVQVLGKAMDVQIVSSTLHQV